MDRSYLYQSRRRPGEEPSDPPEGKDHSYATETIAWLGEAFEDSNLAVDFLKILGRIFGSRDLTDVSVLSGRTVLNCTKTNLSSPEWAALDRHLSRPWFRWMWVVQEVALSKHLRIFCGDREFAWDDMGPVVLALMHIDAAFREWLVLFAYL